MTHPEEHLSGYVDGTLATDERAEVDAHLATCATCREEIELATRAVTMLRELPEVPVPFGTTRPVMAEAGKARTSRARRPWGGRTQGAAACLAKPGGLSGEDRLVRLIQATFQGRPAYVGVYLENPGSGQPSDRIVIWVVARRDCSILSFSSKRL